MKFASAATERGVGRTLLVAMPVAALHYPVIGLSLLKGALARQGMAADIRHFYLDFADYIGFDAYAAVEDARYFLAMVGDWVFAGAAHDTPQAEPFTFLNGLMTGDYGRYFSAPRLMGILTARTKAPGFIDHCFGLVDWSRYAVVGFSTSFQQTMASLALARRIKAAYPHILIVFGGANCSDEMGVELHRRYPSIDVVVGGEAEEVLPELLRRHAAGLALDGLPGTTVRGPDGATVPATVPAGMITDMDSLPALDYADFYADRARLPAVAERFPAFPLFESARGCWWGQKHHCTFCGLNGLGMAYRSKSQDRAYAELTAVADRFGREIMVVDNILDSRYFGDFLPRLAALDRPLLLHYEVKANLRAGQLALLGQAGVRKIQPGVESLSTPVLALMRKGTTLLRNVQTLRLAAEAGVLVDWSHLYGFPGETADHYRAAAAVVPKITHLHPPGGFHRVRADRFSPYFNDPAAFGVTIQPVPGYAHIYPHDADSLARLAYHFDMVPERPDEDLAAAHAALAAQLDLWRTGEATLTLTPVSDGGAPGVMAVVEDGRAGPPRRHELDAVATAVLAACAEIQGAGPLLTLLAPRFGAEAVTAAVAGLERLDLLLREGDELLALPLRQPGFARAPRHEEIRTSWGRSYFHHAQQAAARVPEPVA
ncbi:RiPP maturation radical SAM C-methyltransferase [Nitrospirillum sp. BR 11828]|uniref:RiPP maturation radical SAM C-methyltransferase n=1 Tax=Nitrospirillum sp. BR 11828 TaxID=3104325 RepID=UPI002ACAAA70|nr:RiPP maturation radical SAM C-methyltransferase [Nitrospirillum sp. BR 11828]MDZ5650689.1 RiPP maturation radical SAM C-methyltransferase [Nitrospirillum sp. BR 11828]